MPDSLECANKNTFTKKDEQDSLVKLDGWCVCVFFSFFVGSFQFGIATLDAQQSSLWRTTMFTWVFAKQTLLNLNLFNYTVTVENEHVACQHHIYLPTILNGIITFCVDTKSDTQHKTDASWQMMGYSISQNLKRFRKLANLLQNQTILHAKFLSSGTELKLVQRIISTHLIIIHININIYTYRSWQRWWLAYYENACV